MMYIHMSGIKLQGQWIGQHLYRTVGGDWSRLF